MMLINHLVVSLASWNVVTQTGVLPEYVNVAPWTYALVALGTALPDIDHPNSTLGSRIKFLSWPLSAIFGHRTVTHSLIAVAGMMLLFYYYPFLAGLAFGYIFHLVGDFFTPSGLKLFWPVKRNFRSPITITTNSGAEYIVVWGLCAVVLTYTHSPDELVNWITSVL